jgi:hypothetical protein
MVINMTQNYCMVNETTNICDNITLWDGNPNTWTPPPGYLMLVQADTMALVWLWDAAIPDWVLGQAQGQGQIGFVWNGTDLVTNEPKPAPPKPQPTTEGAQSL